MDLPIVSKEMQFNRGADAARQGRPRTSHNMNHDAAALPDWLEGFDYVMKAREKGVYNQAAGRAWP